MGKRLAVKPNDVHILETAQQFVMGDINHIAGKLDRLSAPDTQPRPQNPALIARISAITMFSEPGDPVPVRLYDCRIHTVQRCAAHRPQRPKNAALPNGRIHGLFLHCPAPYTLTLN